MTARGSLVVIPIYSQETQVLRNFIHYKLLTKKLIKVNNNLNCIMKFEKKNYLYTLIH